MSNPGSSPAQRSAEDMFLRAFASSGLETQSPHWVATQRRAARDAFAKSGLPHRKQEAWKYTDLRRFLRDAYALAPARTGVATHPIAETMCLSEALTQPGLWLRTLFEPSADSIDNSNLFLAREGALARVPAGVKLDDPISIHHDGADDGVMTHARSLIQIEPGASGSLIETVSTLSAGLTTSSVKIDVQERASLTHIRIAETDMGAIWLGQDHVSIGAAANYRLITIQGGAGLFRQELQADMLGKGAEAQVFGASLCGGTGHLDWRIVLNHRAANTVSRLNSRAALGGKSFGAVQGCVTVAQGAQKSDSHQLARSLLLSEHAQSVHKPELEIFADDVKCGHGATTGALSPDQMFYLRARGIPPHDARAMLVRAFVGEIAEGIPHDSVRNSAEAALARLLTHALEEAA